MMAGLTSGKLREQIANMIPAPDGPRGHFDEITGEHADFR
jgi:hypothetical protein